MTGIVIITYNIETRVFILQVEAIKRFCPEAVIEVFDNSTDFELSEAVKYYCRIYEINYRKTETTNLDPSRSHAFAANYAYQKLRDDYDIICFFDHDLIPVKPFSPKDILGDNMIAGVTQGKKIKYLWPGCLFINNCIIDKDIVNFSVKTGLDTGGELHNIIDRYPDRVVYFNEIGCNNPLFTEGFYHFYIMIHNKTFLHFLNTSGWNGKESANNDIRISSLISIANDLINDVEKNIS